MKTYILVFMICFVTVYVSGQMEKDAILQKRIKECFVETKVPLELQQSNPTGLLDNPNLKCFSACMMKKKGTMRDGKIDPERQLSVMHPEAYDLIKEVVNTCSSNANQQEDECEIAYSYVKCLIKNVSVYQRKK